MDVVSNYELNIFIHNTNEVFDVLEVCEQKNAEKYSTTRKSWKKKLLSKHPGEEILTKQNVDAGMWIIQSKCFWFSVTKLTI